MSQLRGQRSRSHKAEDKFGDLAEASLQSRPTPFGRVDLLVFYDVMGSYFTMCVKYSCVQ